MEQEQYFYQSPIGVLRLANEADALAELSFQQEDMLPDNNPHPAAPILVACIRQLDDYFSGENLSFDLPLAQPGTAFQQKVWNGLLAIPAGRTCSYMDLSKKLGDPKAIRAVGTANGKNNIAIVVPCHRVIGSNGSLVGYAGELWRKQWLLAHEAKYSAGVQTLF
ncbi:MAG: methylated-DNA--[protein]-cysteine S-methyltransferase [Ferruginibacter sp.]|nr:methylated-DNA--[protein]-cysteine S-methyltransferase [Ferruginibacter sp.]